MDYTTQDTFKSFGKWFMEHVEMSWKSAAAWKEERQKLESLQFVLKNHQQ